MLYLSPKLYNLEDIFTGKLYIGVHGKDLQGVLEEEAEQTNSRTQSKENPSCKKKGIVVPSCKLSKGGMEIWIDVALTIVLPFARLDAHNRGVLVVPNC
jgi:hypothetical protein